MTDKPNKLSNFITGSNVLLVILVAIGSFSLSYSALSDLASKNGFAEWRAYILPLVIDIGMLAFGLAVVHAHLHGTSPLRRRLLNLLYTITTVIFNLVHAPNNLLAQGLSIIPPLTLFFTFEVLMAMVEHNIKRAQEQATITGYDNALQQAQQAFNALLQQVAEREAQYQADVAAHESRLQEAQQALDEARNPVDTRRARILSLITNHRAEYGTEPTQGYLAEQTGVSIQTIRGDIKALNGKVRSD